MTSADATPPAATIRMSYGAQRDGLWCDKHALPHVSEVTTYLLHPGGAVTPGPVLRECGQGEPQEHKRG